MEKVVIRELHAYLMEDGEILICESIAHDGFFWTSSLGEGVVTSKPCKYIEAIPLGFVGEDLKVQILISA